MHCTRFGLTSAEVRRTIPALPCQLCWHYCTSSLVCGWLSFLKWHVFYSSSASCPSRPPRPFSLSWLPANPSPACSIAWGYYFPAVGLCFLEFHASVIQFLQLVHVPLNDSSLAPQHLLLPVYKITGSNIVEEMRVSLMGLYKLRTEQEWQLCLLYSSFCWKTACAAVLHGAVDALTGQDETKGWCSLQRKLREFIWGALTRTGRIKVPFYLYLLSQKSKLLA